MKLKSAQIRLFTRGAIILGNLETTGINKSASATKSLVAPAPSSTPMLSATPATRPKRMSDGVSPTMTALCGGLRNKWEGVSDSGGEEE